MKTILLTGASGFLGGNFCRFYKADYNIYAAYLHNPVTFEKVNPVQVNLSDSASLDKLFSEIQFDFVVHLAASSDPNFCELHPQESYTNNVTATQNLAHICRSRKIPLLFASTDLVFDGENAPYKEADTPKPIMKYGRQKAAAEQIVLKANPNINITVRLPLLYGNSFNSGKSFIQQILQKLGNKEDVFLFTDEYRTVTSARSVCEAFKILMEKSARGIFHLGGNEKLSRFEMGEVICDIYGFDKKYLKPSLQKDVKMPALRPRDVSLTNNKIKSLGWNPGTFREELMLLKTEN